MAKTHHKKSRKGKRGFDKRQWKALNDTTIYDSVVWESDDIPTDVSVNPEMEWRNINWKLVEKRVFKLSFTHLLQSIQPWRNPQDA